MAEQKGMGSPGDRTHRIAHVRQFCSRLPAVLTPRRAAVRVHKSSSNSGPQLCRTTPADLLVRGIAYLGRIRIQRIQATRGVPCFAAECCGDTLASTSCRASQQTLCHCVEVNLGSVSRTNKPRWTAAALRKGVSKKEKAASTRLNVVI